MVVLHIVLDEGFWTPEEKEIWGLNPPPPSQVSSCKGQTVKPVVLPSEYKRAAISLFAKLLLSFCCTSP